MSDPGFLRRGASGVTVDLRVQPRARRAALATADGALRASVTAPPEDGKANAAVIALLADAWRLPKSSFDVIKGQTARAKTVRVAGEPGVLVERIARWVEARGCTRRSTVTPEAPRRRKDGSLNRNAARRSSAGPRARRTGRAAE